MSDLLLIRIDLLENVNQDSSINDFPRFFKNIISNQKFL